MIIISSVKKMLWSTFKFQKEGRRQENMNRLVSMPNLNDEYKQAFRTKSYSEICNKVQSQLDGQSSYSLSTTPHLSNLQLADHLLEPRQETLIPILENPNLQIFAEYFKTSMEAFKSSELLLKNINQERINYLATQNLIKQIKCDRNGSSWTNDDYYQVQNVLASFASQNSFSVINTEKLRELHHSHMLLYRELTSQCKKTKRRIKVNRCIKLIKTVSQVVGCSALAAALLVLAVHSTIGVVVGPIILLCFLVLFLVRKKKRRLNKNQFKRLFAQLDAAARGVYTLINDFDTVSWLEKTMGAETERMHLLVDVCVKKGKHETLKLAARLFQMQEPGYLGQLEELEKHTYLSFLNINRTRKQVVLEMNRTEN